MISQYLSDILHLNNIGGKTPYCELNLKCSSVVACHINIELTHRNNCHVTKLFVFSHIYDDKLSMTRNLKMTLVSDITIFLLGWWTGPNICNSKTSLDNRNTDTSSHLDWRKDIIRIEIKSPL